MGIGGFHRWLVSNFPEIVRVQGGKISEVYDHVAFDLNQIFHQAARKSANRTALAAAIFRELDHILKACVPRKSIFLAFDGPAPLAKLMTQRQRRSKERVVYTSQSSRSNRSRRAVRAIDGTEFTPGVDTVYYVRDAIDYWCHTRLQNDYKYRNVDVRVSPADVPGEGELKLIDFCRTGNVDPDDSFIVVGGDADIVLQGLATVPVRNFFVYLRKIDRSSNQPKSHVLSVWELARSLERRFRKESSSVRIDFIVLAMMTGNDYIPKLRGCSLPRLWRRYVDLKTSNTRTGPQPSFKGLSLIDAERRTFNWAFLHALVEDLGSRVKPIDEIMRFRREERAMLLGEHQGNGPGNAQDGQMKSAQTIGEDAETGEVIMYDGDETGVLESQGELHSKVVSTKRGSQDDLTAFSGSSAQLEASEYDGDEEEDMEDEEVIEEDHNHLANLVEISGNPSLYMDTERWCRMLLWTLQMYVDGFCSDYSFLYDKPFAPSYENVATYIRDHNGDPFAVHSPVSNNLPLLPHQAAFAILPVRAKDLLPRPLQKLLEDPETVNRLSIKNNDINVPEMLRAINNIPLTAYNAQERERIVHGRPYLLRVPRARDRTSQSNARIKKPGPKYQDIKPRPVIHRRHIPVTTAPPCYPWPSGAFADMLRLEYKVVAGNQLPRRTTQTGDNSNAPVSAPGRKRRKEANAPS